MNHLEIRKKFLKFFEERGHKIVLSSSLIPSADDPSLLFTTAGMQQFKPYYLGEKDPLKDFGAKRTTSVQKCFRTSDIDEIGDDTHLTFFEMLGNFSFNDYGKKETIQWAYDFLTKEMNIPVSYASIFKGENDIPRDDKSFKILKESGVKDIREFCKKENFWGPTGRQGPCGPNVEYYSGNTELWNLVFNEYFCDLEKNNIEKIKNPGVDTGMGFERLKMILENKTNVYETSLFAPLIKIIEQESLKFNLKFARILADHIKGIVFISSEGILPSNIERGYVLRRLIRRILRYGRLLEFPEKNFQKLAKATINIYQEVYPELLRNEAKIYKIIEEETKAFSASLTKGLKEFEKMASKGALAAKEAFFLYETFGFPFELTKELALERKIKLNENEFQKEFASHQEISRLGAEKKFGGHGLENSKFQIPKSKIIKFHTATHLLQAALREIFGTEVKQMGSDINEERTRFDFSFDGKPTEEKLKKIEERVNEIIAKDLPVIKKEMSYEEALKQGALAFFKEKYPETVTVYQVDGFSKEICAGPHVQKTGEIGSFKILKEEGIGKGIRRIKGTIV